MRGIETNDYSIDEIDCSLPSETNLWIAVAVTFIEDAQAWKRKADRLNELYDQLPSLVRDKAHGDLVHERSVLISLMNSKWTKRWSRDLPIDFGMVKRHCMGLLEL